MGWRMGGKPAPTLHDVKSIQHGRKVFPDREVGEERIADGIENREVCDLERCSQWKVSGVEEGLLTAEGVVIWVGMGSAGSDEHIQGRWSVVADIDGEIERVGNAGLSQKFLNHPEDFLDDHDQRLPWIGKTRRIEQGRQGSFH
jgi:hypothetical protein